MAAFLDVCRFTPTAGGTTDWAFSTAVVGYQSPSAAGAVNGAVYRYRAESADLSQWEIGYGAYNSGTGVFARSTVLFNSLGTTAKVSFAVAPQVAIVALAEDLQALFHRSYLAGLTLSTAGASASFAVAAGQCADSTNADTLALAAALTKTTAAWAVGTGNGSFDGTGSAPSATAAWYHVHAIKRTDTGVVDVLTSNSAAAPTLPANYGLFRRIGSLKTNGSFQWIAFVQNGDNFMWSTPVQDVAATNPGTAAVSRTLSTPLGVITQALLFVGANTSVAADNPAAIYISDLALADIAPNLTTAGGSVEVFNATVAFVGGGQVSVNTNTSSQVRSRLQVSSTGTVLYIQTDGWIDRRGRDS